MSCFPCAQAVDLTDSSFLSQVQGRRTLLLVHAQAGGGVMVRPLSAAFLAVGRALKGSDVQLATLKGALVCRPRPPPLSSPPGRVWHASKRRSQRQGALCVPLTCDWHL